MSCNQLMPREELSSMVGVPFDDVYLAHVIDHLFRFLVQTANLFRNSVCLRHVSSHLVRLRSPVLSPSWEDGAVLNQMKYEARRKVIRPVDGRLMRLKDASSTSGRALGKYRDASVSQTLSAPACACVDLNIGFSSAFHSGLGKLLGGSNRDSSCRPCSYLQGSSIELQFIMWNRKRTCRFRDEQMGPQSCGFDD